MNRFDKFLDKLAYYSIQSIRWVGIGFWVVIFGIVFYNALNEDPVIGTTDHGIIIRESDIKEEKE